MMDDASVSAIEDGSRIEVPSAVFAAAERPPGRNVRGTRTGSAARIAAPARSASTGSSSSARTRSAVRSRSTIESLRSEQARSTAPQPESGGRNRRIRTARTAASSSQARAVA